MTKKKMSQDAEIDYNHFIDEFHVWLSWHGVQLTGQYDGANFSATIDLNKLKVGIMELMSNGEPEGE